MKWLVNTSGLTYVDQIPGAFLFFRSQDFSVGPILNEAYFIWMEDVDFCYRIHQSGQKVAVLADERVLHVGGASFKMRSEAWKRLVFMRSYLMYSELNYGILEYFFQITLMLLNSLAIILISPIITIKKGLKYAVNRIKIEVKTIKLISASAACRFFRKPNRNVNENKLSRRFEK